MPSGGRAAYRKTSLLLQLLLVKTEGAFTFCNINYVAKFLNSIVSDTDNSLKTGTAFIKLDFIFKSWPYCCTGALGALPINGASWPVYLQYRSGPGQTWSTAIDVEGQEIRFGGNTKKYSSPSPWKC